MEKTFKKGDRVRLKAWVTTPKLAGADNLLPHGCVGICDGSDKAQIVNAIPYVDVQTPKLPKTYHRAIVAIEDLELMPERQVHVVKDGKVYERRNVEGVFCCKTCSFDNPDGFCAFPKAPCEGGFYNFQEVKSGKLVS